MRQGWAAKVEEIAFALAALGSTLPLFVARFVPIQDLPQHAAAVRVLTDYGASETAFARYFVLTPFETQYLSVYALAWLLAPAFGALLALKLVVAASVAALPYALRSLLRALDGSESHALALLALPLSWGAELVLGFFHFVAALPLVLWGLALGVELARSWSRGRAVALGALACIVFVTHVVPFAVLVVGLGMLSARDGLGPTLRRLVPLAPSLCAFVAWLSLSRAGTAAASLFSPGGLERAHFLAPAQALAALPGWLGDVLPGDLDDVVFALWALVVAALLVLRVVRAPRRDSGAAEPFFRTARGRLSLLAALTFVAYLVAPTSYSWIWPVSGRFAALFAVLVLAVLPPLSLREARAFGGFALALGAFSTALVAVAFRRAATTEYAGLARVLEVLPPGRRVAGLVYSPSSHFVRFAPYLHAAAYYQLERGGAVMFTFADFPQSPFRFREQDRPPRVPPRWEWLPERVDPERDLAWYDHLLTRGGPAQLRGWRRIAAEGAWSAWSR